MKVFVDNEQTNERKVFRLPTNEGKVFHLPKDIEKFIKPELELLEILVRKIEEQIEQLEKEHARAMSHHVTEELRGKMQDLKEQLALGIENIDLRIEAQNQKCLPMLNNNAINALMGTTTTRKRGCLEFNANTGVARIQKNGCGVILEDFFKLKGLRVSVHKLLCMALADFTNKNSKTAKNTDYIARIRIEDYMGLCGIPITKANKDKAIRTVKEDLSTLEKTQLRYEGLKGDMISPHIIGTNGISKGEIFIAIDAILGENLVKSNYIMQLSPQILQISNQSPTTYQIAYKLNLHQSNHNNIAKGTANILSVKKLLAVCDNIPSFEEVRQSKTNRHINKRIIEPFEKALNALEGEKTIKWNYCKQKREPLTDEELANMDGGVFEKLYVEFEYLDLPDQKEQIKAKKQTPQKIGKKKATKND